MKKPPYITVEEMRTHPVGTGPFRFESASEDQIRLRTNPDYWGRQETTYAANFSRVLIKPCDAEKGTILGEYKDGSHIWEIKRNQYDKFIPLHSALDVASLHEYGGINTLYLAFNLDPRKVDPIIGPLNSGATQTINQKIKIEKNMMNYNTISTFMTIDASFQMVSLRGNF